MADPRLENLGPQQRRANHSPLMQALSKRGPGDGVVNFCPFGCQSHQLDEHGWCAHLIGFYDKGRTYEPRIQRKKDGRIITSGKARKPMEKGLVLVQITTTARVYSKTPLQHLTVKRDEADRHLAEIMEEERRLLDAAERIRTPMLEGEWGESDYALTPTQAAPAAAAT